MLLHEPRSITALMAVAWVVVIIAGIGVITDPPALLAYAATPLLARVWGGLILAGGILGVLGCPPGWWWVERSGILAAGTGLAGFAWVYLREDSPMWLTALHVVLILSLIMRWIRIRGAQLDPTRGG